MTVGSLTSRHTSAGVALMVTCPVAMGLLVAPSTSKPMCRDNLQCGGPV